MLGQVGPDLVLLAIGGGELAVTACARLTGNQAAVRGAHRQVAPLSATAETARLLAVRTVPSGYLTI